MTDQALSVPSAAQDQDISFFLSRPSTVENVCLFCWRNLAVLLRPHPVTCAEISVTVPGCRQTASSRAIHSTTATFSGEMGTLHVGASWPASDFNAEQLYVSIEEQRPA